MIRSIFAVDANGGLGKDGTLPWPKDGEDLRWFKESTTGDMVVMGKNTWLDPMMPKPLPNRTSVIVATKDYHLCDAAHMVISGDHLIPALGELQSRNPHRTIWIIGGAQLLTSTKGLSEEIYLTRFDRAYECDVKIDLVEYLRGYELRKEIPGKDKRFQIYAKLS